MSIRSVFILLLAALGLGAFQAGCRSRHTATLGPDSYASMNLPRGTSATDPLPGPEIRVTREAIYATDEGGVRAELSRVVPVQYGRVDPSLKLDGELGFVIKPLLAHLGALDARLQSAGQPGESHSRRTLRVALNGRAPYRLMAEVLVTINQTKFGSVQLLTRRRSGALGAIVLENYPACDQGAPTVSRRDPGGGAGAPATPGLADAAHRAPAAVGAPAPEPFDLTVVITTRGLYIRSRRGSECPATTRETDQHCFTFAKAGEFSAEVLGRFQRHLYGIHRRFLEPRKFGLLPCERGRVTVIPEPIVRVSDLVAVLDALREVPKDLLPVEQRSTYPAAGCRSLSQVQRGDWSDVARIREGRWGLDVTNEPACMFHLVSLAREGIESR